MMGYIDYFLLLLLGLLIIILFLLASQAKSPQRKSTARKVKTNSQDILLGKNFTSHSPIIKLTFEEALDADAFMTEIHDFGLHYAEAACREMFKVENDKKKLPQTQVPLIQNVSIPGTTDNPLDTGKIIWELSKEGRRLFKQGKIEWLKNKKTGKFLPHFPNKRNSKFKDILRSYSTEDIVKISKLVNMAVVNAAHLVSGADQAREMKLIRNKLEYLVDARKIDRLGKLESNFYLAKELLANMANGITKSKILDLHREIVEMRTLWRNEIEYKLKNIEDPNAKSFFDKLFTSRKTRDRQVHSELSQFEEEIALIDFSFIYDISLCASVGHLNTGLANEIDRLERTRNLLVEKAAYLSGNNEEFKIDRHIEQLDKIIRRYRNFLYKY